MYLRVIGSFLLILAAGVSAATPIPLGILPDAATPLAYRLDLTVVP